MGFIGQYQKKYLNYKNSKRKCRQLSKPGERHKNIVLQSDSVQTRKHQDIIIKLLKLKDKEEPVKGKQSTYKGVPLKLEANSKCWGQKEGEKNPKTTAPKNPKNIVPGKTVLQTKTEEAHLKISILLNNFKKLKRKYFQTHFMRLASITLIPKADKDTIRK